MVFAHPGTDIHLFLVVIIKGLFKISSTPAAVPYAFFEQFVVQSAIKNKNILAFKILTSQLNFTTIPIDAGILS